MSLSRKERNAEDRWHISVGGLDNPLALFGVGYREGIVNPEGV